MLFDDNLLNFIVCPITKSPLTFDKSNNLLISPALNRAFPIKEGVPILLLEESVSYPIVGSN